MYKWLVAAIFNRTSLVKSVNNTNTVREMYTFGTLYFPYYIESVKYLGYILPIRGLCFLLQIYCFILFRIFTQLADLILSCKTSTRSKKGVGASIHRFYVSALFIVQYIGLVDTIRCVMRHNNGIFSKTVHCRSWTKKVGASTRFKFFRKSDK